MLNLTHTQARLLADIIEGGGDDMERFYLDHEDDLEDIEKLEHSGFLMKETDNAFVAWLPVLPALRARGSVTADRILDFCDKLLKIARRLNKFAPNQKITVSMLAKEVGADESKVQRALRYLRYAPVWHASEGPVLALTAITPNSREMTRYNKGLESIIEWMEKQRASSLYAPAAPPPSTVDQLHTPLQSELRVPSATPVAAAVSAGRDVFICHASEDKEVVARPLVAALQARGLTVWFDEFELLLGDSLRRKIEEGLSASRFGVTILSHDFFAKRWPQKELDALLALETESKKILPIRHNLSADDISQFAPLIADKYSVSTREGIDAVADAVVKAVSKSVTEAKEEPKTFAEQARIVYPPRAKDIERISVLDFYKQAQRSGFKLMGGARTALQIAQDIRQAALDGTLQTWGKSDSIGGPLVKIPPEHWKDFRLYWEQCFKFGPPDGQIEGLADDNSLVGTHGARTTNSGRRGYIDVHLDTEQAKALLET